LLRELDIQYKAKNVPLILESMDMIIQDVQNIETQAMEIQIKSGAT